MKKIIVVGLGQMGINYMKNLLAIGYQQEDIIGIDIDPTKIKQAKNQWPAADYCETLEGDIPKVAIVCTNTPSHHRVIIDLAERGASHIFCEKPLGMNVAAVSEIGDAIIRTGTKVFTAFLINFSPVLADLTDLMQRENLIITEGHVIWGKNRFGNNRPTPGDLEDESVHGVGVLHMLAGINQNIKGIKVSGRLTYPKYVNEDVQEKAMALDVTFPAADAVNASSMILEQVMTNHHELTFSIHSSYLLGVQRREVGVLLCKENDPKTPVYYAGMEFDIKIAGNTADRLTLTKIEDNSIKVKEKTCDKVLEETVAFLRITKDQEKDPRSTGFVEALMAVRFSDAVFRSHKNGGEVIKIL